MTDNKKPTHRAFIVKNFTDKDGKEKSRWLEIGSVWPHEDGKGFDREARRRADRRKIVIRLDKPKPATGTEANA